MGTAQLLVIWLKANSNSKDFLFGLESLSQANQKLWFPSKCLLLNTFIEKNIYFK